MFSDRFDVLISKKNLKKNYFPTKKTLKNNRNHNTKYDLVMVIF
jgi:hypothetical protein